MFWCEPLVLTNWFVQLPPALQPLYCATYQLDSWGHLDLLELLHLVYVHKLVWNPISKIPWSKLYVDYFCYLVSINISPARLNGMLLLLLGLSTGWSAKCVNCSQQVFAAVSVLIGPHLDPSAQLLVFELTWLTAWFFLVFCPFNVSLIERDLQVGGHCYWQRLPTFDSNCGGPDRSGGPCEQPTDMGSCSIWSGLH